MFSPAAAALPTWVLRKPISIGPVWAFGTTGCGCASGRARTCARDRTADGSARGAARSRGARRAGRRARLLGRRRCARRRRVADRLVLVRAPTCGSEHQHDDEQREASHREGVSSRASRKPAATSAMKSCAVSVTAVSPCVACRCPCHTDRRVGTPCRLELRCVRGPHVAQGIASGDGHDRRREPGRLREHRRDVRIADVAVRDVHRDDLLDVGHVQPEAVAVLRQRLARRRA